MNLTKPPEVSHLPAERVEQLRTGLVRRARRQARRRSVPRWVPVVAAAAGVAMVVVGIAVVDRRDHRPDSRPAPAGPAVVTPTRPGVVGLDLGPATEAEAREMIKKCLGVGPGQAIKPEDPYTIEWARWMKKLATRDDNGNWQNKAGRQLVAVVTSADGQHQAWCQDGRSPWSGTTGAAAPDTVTGGTNGGSSASDQPGRPWGMVRAIGLTVAPRIAEVEMRFRWKGGASPWYAGYVDADSLSGYIEAAAIGGRGSPPADAKAEVRAFDDTGRLIYTETTG